MTLPVQTQAVADERGLLTPTWRRWLADLERRVSSSQNDSLAADIAAIATALGSPDGTVGNIPEQASTDALIVGLDGILTEGRLSSGRVTVRLVDLEDTGEGAGLYKITRDAKGRVEGTQAATAADLAYDNTTSGLTATDAQAAIDELAAGGGGGSAGLDPSAETYVFDEFGLVGNWTTTTSGSGSGASQLGPTDGRYGVTEVKTGTLTTGACFYSDPVGAAIKLGGGTELELHYFFKTDVLPDGTNNYALAIGLLGALGGTVNDRLHLRYSNDVNGGNWTVRTQIAGVSADVNGSFGPAASTWYRARIVVNAAGTEASIYVRPKGGSEQLVGTTTNITTAALYNVFLIAKTAGTTSRSLFCDAAARWHRYSPER